METSPEWGCALGSQVQFFQSSHLENTHAVGTEA